MTLFQIVALYTALNLILLPILMYRIGQIRIRDKVNLGNGDDNPELFARIRAHGNFTETAPFALIGLLGLASLSAAPLALHIFGGAFTFGRFAHAHGMSQKDAAGRGRLIGTLLSLLTFLGMALYMLYLVFAG